MNQPTYKDLLANTWIKLAKELEDEAGDEVSRKAATNRAYAKCLQTCAEQLHRATIETRMDEEYLELLMAVESKHAGETRHQTALRYIVEREIGWRNYESKRTDDES